jgi:hypothetical protein
MRLFQLLACVFFAVAFSAWLARAEMHTDDTGILAGLIAIGGFVLSMIEPRRPWMWGLIVPAGIIAVNVWRHSENWGGLLGIAAFTIAIACAGAYVGAFIRRCANAQSRGAL